MPSIFSTANFNRRLSPNERRFRLAEILTRGATDTSPIQSIFQGGSRLVQALLARQAFDKATSDEKSLKLQRGNDLAQAVRAGQGLVNQGVAPGFTPTGQIPAGATDLDALPAGTQLLEGDPNAMARALLQSQDSGLQKSGLSMLANLLQRKGKLTDATTARTNKVTDATTAFERAEKLKGIAPGRTPVPGVDIIFSADVQNQRNETAGAKRASGLEDKISFATDPRVLEAKKEVAAAGRPQLEPFTVGNITIPRNIRTGDPLFTPGQKALDKAFGKEFASFIASGGAADAKKNLKQLREVAERLDSGKEDDLTGPIVGNIPNFIRTFVAPRSLAVQEQVEEVVQRNLRIILGAQFTEKEGVRLIARAFNPALSEQENARRLRRLITAMEGAIEAKLKAAQYFQDNGTLVGYDGVTQFSIDFFEQAIEGGEEAGTVSSSTTGAGSGSVPDGLSEGAKELLKKLQ